MPQTVEELLAVLDLEALEVDLFRGRQPDTRLQRVFGGQVAAQSLVAAVRTVEADRAVHSLHSYFLRPGDPAVPIVYDVERLRDGRGFSTRRVAARQHGRPIFFLSASFHVPERGFDHQDAMPAVAAAEDCPTLGEVLAAVSKRSSAEWDREWSALDLRYAADSRPGGALHGGASPALARVWVRVAGRLADEPWQHAAALAYASDLTLLAVALVPHGTYLGAPGLQPASLDHAMWFHRPFRADEWLLYDQASPSASDGRALTTGRLFAADGRLVATVAQEGLLRVTD